MNPTFARIVRMQLFPVLPSLVYLGPLLCFSCSAAIPTSKRATLTNGLAIAALHFPGSTNVSIFTFLPLGLAADAPDKVQWAHLVEHMVIRSTIPENSPVANAETLPDHMRLDFYGNSSNWAEGLKHTRDWLQGIPFTKAQLQAEKPKAIAECEFTVKNLATHKFAMAAWAQAFRHGKSHASIKGDLNTATLPAIQDYRDRFLAPPGKVLVCIAGGLPLEQMFEVATDSLSSVQLKGVPIPPIKPHPELRAITWDLDARHLVLTWPIPPATQNDHAPFPAIAQWLSMQFFQNAKLKELTGMVLAGADLTTPEGQYFYVSASLKPDATFPQVREIIDTIISGSVPPQAAFLGKQIAAQLTRVPSQSELASMSSAGMTIDMMQRNVALQWGMNEYRYPNKAAMVAELAGLNSELVAQALNQLFSTKEPIQITLEPGNKPPP